MNNVEWFPIETLPHDDGLYVIWSEFLQKEISGTMPEVVAGRHTDPQKWRQLGVTRWRRPTPSEPTITLADIFA